MNMTQQQGHWNIFKNATALGNLHAWTEGMSALVTKTGRHLGRISKATAAMFTPRHHVSSLQVTWAGVLRSDCDRLVPEQSEEVRFQVANQMFLCEEGKPLVFDDSWNQEAWDNTTGYRVVFLTSSARTIKEPMRQRLQDFITRLVRI
jgi:hypothetical protein